MTAMPSPPLVSQFTPGPWRVDACDDGDFRIVQDCHFGEPICAIPGLELSSDDDEANARLIAAAPDLLEALEAAKKHIEALTADIFNRVHQAEELGNVNAFVGIDDGKFDGTWASYRDQIDAAILAATARGGGRG